MKERILGLIVLLIRTIFIIFYFGFRSRLKSGCGRVGLKNARKPPVSFEKNSSIKKLEKVPIKNYERFQNSDHDCQKTTLYFLNNAQNCSNKKDFVDSLCLSRQQNQRENNNKNREINEI